MIGRENKTVEARVNIMEFIRIKISRNIRENMD